MVSGEPGSLQVSALRPVEEDLSISPGAVTLLLLPMEGTFVRGIIPSTFPAIKNNVSQSEG